MKSRLNADLYEVFGLVSHRVSHTMVVWTWKPDKALFENKSSNRPSFDTGSELSYNYTMRFIGCDSIQTH